MGTLNEALKNKEIGIKVVGGKGKISLNTPNEIIALREKSVGEEKHLDSLIYVSRMSAKVDNVLVQDGFNLYFHSMVITENSGWAVIEQGMSKF